MDNNDIQFYITGDKSKELAGIVMEAYKHEFGDNADITTMTSQEHGNDIHKFDPSLVMAAAALVLSIPSVILAVTDLVDKIQHKKKVNSFLDRVKKSVKKEDHKNIKVITAKKKVYGIDVITSTELFDYE